MVQVVIEEDIRHLVPRAVTIIVRLRAPPSRFFILKKWRNLIKMTNFGDFNDDFDEFGADF